MGQDIKEIPKIDKTAPADEKFKRKLEMLRDNPGNENFVKPDRCEVLKMFEKVDRHLHGKKLETSAMGLLGPK